MLAAKGYRTELFLEGSRRKVRPKGAMLHDESGRDWPYGSVLFMPFQRNCGDVDDASDDRSAIDYFGYTPRAGCLTLPEIEIDDWEPLGEVARINYTRPGGLPAISNGFLDLISIWKRPAKNFRGDYTHEFKDKWFHFGTGKPRLFRMGSIYRLEFPPWSTINWRGFVEP